MGMRTRLALLGFAVGNIVAGAAIAAAVVPDDFVGPPAITANGCPANVEWTDVIVAKSVGVTPWEFVRMRDVRGFTYDDFCNGPRGKFNRALKKATRPPQDNPGQWAKFRAMQQSDEHGIVKGDGLYIASQQRNAMLVPRGRGVAGITPSTWTALGPGNIGGRIRGISSHPTNAGEILIGGIAGGIQRTTNGGTTWTPVNDFMANLAISSIQHAPSNGSIVYAGTGESFFNTDAVRGLGVFKSTDGGVTWSQLAATLPVDDINNTLSDFFYVNRVVVHPTNPSIVLAATRSYYYCDFGGLYRSIDGGSSWTKVYDRPVNDAKFDPSAGNSDRVAVADAPHCHSPDYQYNQGGAVSVTSNITATTPAWLRTTLSTANPPLNRVEIAWAKATPGLLLAVVDYNGGSGPYGQLYYTANAGTTWNYNSTPGHLGDQGWYANALWVDPTDSTRVVVGGLDLYRGAGAPSWWVGGPTALSWTKISDWGYGGSYGPSVHADHHAIVSDAGYNGTTNRKVYFGNDGGMYVANDITIPNGNSSGTGWTSLNNGLFITQFYGGSGKNFGGTVRIAGGTQDNGNLVAPQSGTNWVDTFGGDGGYAAVDPNDSNYVYGEYIYAMIHRSTSGGASFSSGVICNGTANNVNNIADGLTAYSPLNTYPNANCGTLATGLANFIPPFILDPNNVANQPSRMLVGGNSLWLTANSKAAAPIWSAIKAPSGSNNFISAIAVATGDSNKIWVGHNNGEVWCTINGGTNWTQVVGTPGRMVLRIMVDPSNANRVFVANGGYSSPNLFELTDATQVCKASPTVTARHNNLPLAPIRSVVRHQANTNWLYVGTEVGIFATTDGGVTWSASNDGPGNVPVDELFWIDSTTLVAATHGRGMFKANVGSGALQFTSSAVSTPEAGGPITLNVTRSGGSSGAVSVTYGTANGTALAGTNYVATSGNFNWADGDTSTKSFNVSILNDGIATGNKAFTASLTSPTGGATLGANSTVTVTIQDASLTVPGAPQSLASTPGNGSASFTFSPPASNGGSAITSYTVTCNPGALTVSGAGSPLTLSSLANGTTYTCSATATNAVGTGAASSTVTVTPALFNLTGAVSRHQHGITQRDISIDRTQPIGGAITVEPRAIGTGHKVIFTFGTTITSTGTVACKDAGNVDVGSCSATLASPSVTVTIPTMPDGQRATISLTNVSGALVNAAVSVAFLKGDVNGTHSVTASDILAEKGKTGQAVGAATFPYDVDVNNTLTSTDVTVIKGNSGASAP